MLQKLKNLIKFVFLSSTVSSKPTVSANVEYYDVTKQALLLYPYGLQANPKSGIMGILFNVEANEDNQVVIPSDVVNRDTLDEGEVAVGIPELTARITFKKDGSIKIIDKAGQIILMDSAASKITITSPNVTINSQQVTITGGELDVNGSVIPNASGPFCGLPNCLFTGAPQTGSKVTGT